MKLTDALAAAIEKGLTRTTGSLHEQDCRYDEAKDEYIYTDKHSYCALGAALHIIGWDNQMLDETGLGFDAMATLFERIDDHGTVYRCCGAQYFLGQLVTHSNDGHHDSFEETLAMLRDIENGTWLSPSPDVPTWITQENEFYKPTNEED